MADEPETPIRNVYAQRFADDIEAGRKEQSDVIEKIAGLQARLDQLRMDEAWLTQAQSSLPTEVAPSVPEAGTAAGAPSAAKGEQPETPASAEAAADAPPTVPKPRQDRPVKAAQPKHPAKKAAAATAKSPAKKTTAKKTAKKTAAETTTKKTSEKAAAKKKTRPPLRELVLAILLQTPGEPRVTREVTEQLAQDHPDRKTSIPTVRNILEGLVEKNAVEKSHQQGSAMYIARAAEEDAEPAADTSADGEGEQDSATPAEKVPAAV